MTTPIDQHHRDRIRESLDESLFIQAGAGTGKTRSLIDRLVSLVDSGVELRNVAAITFTEAAAAELKDRLRQAIEANAAAQAGTPAEARWLRAQHQLDAAAIQTLHAFAQRILAAHPLEAGLPPGFETMDGVRSELAFDERWQRFLDDFLSESGPAELVETFVALAGDFGELRKVARAIHENWDLLPADQPDPGPRTPVHPSGVIDVLEVLEGCVGQNTAPDPFAEAIAGIPAALAALRDAPNLVATLRILSRIDLKKNTGRAGNWPLGTLKEARLAVDDFRAERDAFRATLGEWCAAAMVAHLSRFALEYAAERRTAGTLDFHDLLAVARNLLRGDDAVRHAIHQRFTRLLIDEFQDTDPLQIEIASLVVRPSSCPGNVPWYEAPVPPGSLVVVGDPKQSIYRFRRADIHLYLSAASTLTATQVELVQNWRSVPALIEWVNEVFVQLIGAEADHDSGQPAYVSLAPGRTAESDAPHVHWFGREYPRMPEAREAEAEAIARAVLTVRDGAWPVQRGDGTSGARLSEIAILFPRRSILPYLERAFEQRGIPYRVESRSLLYETQDVVDLVNILAALVDPTDDVAIVAALRSPAFACSDRDLFAWSEAHGGWDYTRSQPPALGDDHPVAAAMRWLHGAHLAAARRPVNHIVELVIRERRLMELAFAYRRPRERWQRYRFVLEQSRAFASGQGASLRGFVAWMRRQATESADVVETAVPEPDDDAVRLMTVHASKGLEFPVVVLAGLGNRPPTSSRPVVWDGHGHPLVKAGRIQSPGYTQAAALDRSRETAESRRLLYVAATRARDHLLVSLFRGKHNADSHAHHLAGFAEDDAAGWQELLLDEEREDRDASGHQPVLPAEDRDAWDARRQAVIAARTAGSAVAATTVARRLRAGDGLPEVSADSMDEVQPWKRGRAGTSVGRAVHAVLQTVDFANGDGIAEAARAQVIAEGIAGREDEVAALARAALASNAVGEALASGRYWRELFVSTWVEGHLVEGFIDLLYERDGQLVVVDYKTDAVRTPADIDRAVDRYRLQAAAYALALGKQLGREVAECRFVFLRETRPEEHVVEDLPGAIDEITRWLAAQPGNA